MGTAPKPRGVRCHRCGVCYEDGPADGQPPRIVHPETCTIAGALICSECNQKSIEDMRRVGGDVLKAEGGIR